MPDTSPSKGFLRRMFDSMVGSQAKDIELPNESGRVDPRLPKKKPSLIENLRKKKRQVNPFDRVADVLSKSTKKRQDEEED